jgi:GTP-binding protein
LLVLDATDGSTAQDQRLAGMIEEAGRALIIVVNKIDEIDPLDQGRILLRMQNDYVFMRWADAIVEMELN